MSNDPEAQAGGFEKKERVEKASREAPWKKVVGESKEEIEELTRKLKDYARARRGGLRDADTQKHLGDQPEFIDSLRKAEGTKSGTEGASISPGQSVTNERPLEGKEAVHQYSAEDLSEKADAIIDKMQRLLDPAGERQFRADLAQIDDLPAHQRDRICTSIDKIISSRTELTSPEQRTELAASLVHQIADPRAIVQGEKNSGALASVEQTLAREHPEIYADRVAALATDGQIQVTTADGKLRTVTVQTEDGQLVGATDAFGERSLTSEIFQNAAANVCLPEGKVYRSDLPNSSDRPHSIKASEDTGERVFTVDKDGKPTDEPPQEFQGLKAEDQAKVLNSLMARDQYTVKAINTANDLAEAIRENGGTPLNVAIQVVRAGYADVDTGGGGHAVSITEIVRGSDGNMYVFYDNPADVVDHSYPHGQGIPIDQFVASMRGEHDPDNPARAEGVAAAVVNRGHN